MHEPRTGKVPHAGAGYCGTSGTKSIVVRSHSKPAGMQMAKSLQGHLAIALLIGTAITTAVAQAPAETSARNLSLEQQGKIANVISRDAGAPVREVHFSLAIGNTVPADLQLRPVPASVGEVAPQFRGASYLVVEEQIALVDSQTRKILAVIQRGLSQTGAAPAQTR